MTDEEIFNNHTQWMIDNYGRHFTQFIKNFHDYRTYVLNESYATKEYPYNGYLENMNSAAIFYLKRFGVDVIEEKYRYGILVQWNDEFAKKLDVALKIVLTNEKLNKLKKDFE